MHKLNKEINVTLYDMSDICQKHLEGNKSQCDGCPLQLPVMIRITGNRFDSCFRKALYFKNHELGMPYIPKKSEASK